MVGHFSNMMTARRAWGANEEHGGLMKNMEARTLGTGEGLHESLGDADTSKICQPLPSLLHASTCNQENSELAQEPY